MQRLRRQPSPILVSPRSTESLIEQPALMRHSNPRTLLEMSDSVTSEPAEMSEWLMVMPFFGVSLNFTGGSGG